MVLFSSAYFIRMFFYIWRAVVRVSLIDSMRYFVERKRYKTKSVVCSLRAKRREPKDTAYSSHMYYIPARDSNAIVSVWCVEQCVREQKFIASHATILWNDATAIQTSQYICTKLLFTVVVVVFFFARNQHDVFLFVYPFLSTNC